MQGLVGCYAKKHAPKIPVLPQQVVDKMLSSWVAGADPTMNISRHSYPTLAVAILSLDRTPANHRPAYRSVGKRHIFVDGFIKERQEFLDTLGITENISFLTQLAGFSGVYNAMIYDEASDELLVLNDRHGGRYLYCYEDDDWFVFAPNIKTIVSSGVVKNRELDYEAIISLLSHEYIMGDRSLIRTVKLFPFATWLKFDGGRRESARYWNFDSLAEPRHSDCGRDLLAEGTRLLGDAIGSQVGDDAQIIIPLSGGLDSRTIALFLSEKYGSGRCRALHVEHAYEKKLARKVARVLGLDLEISRRRDFGPLNSIDTFILAGAQSIHQFWIYPHLKRKVEQGFGNLIVDGYLMNEVIGGLSTLDDRGYANLNRRYPPSMRLFDFVLDPGLKEGYSARHDSQVAEIVSQCPSATDYDRFLYFTMLSYGRRFTLLFSVIHSYLGSVGLPILDYNLLDFCMRLPHQLKAASRFYRDLVSNTSPAAAAIPWSRNRLPLNSVKDRHFMCDYLQKIDRGKYYLSRLTGTRYEALPSYNKNRAFRKNREYRNFFMNLIMDDRTFDKKYVCKSGLKRVVDLIDTGRNYFDILEKVAIIELVTRELDNA